MPSAGAPPPPPPPDDDSPRKHRKLLEISPPPPPPSPSEKEGSYPEPESYARSYQLEALEMAKQQNTIAFLETGSGKTLIAVMLLRSYAHQIRKPSEFIAVFLVPTVVLVTQQAEVVEMHTDLKVGKFWGEMGVDFWNAAVWKEKLEQYEVFIMTPQILLDNLRHSFFKLEKIKLLIFDECHNARGRSPYACIMTEFYHRQSTSNLIDLPRIFGMTASLINSKVSHSQFQYAKQISELETLMNSKVFTVVNDSVLAQYISFSTPRIKLYEHLDIPSDLFLSISQNLKSLETKHLQALQELMLDDFAEESARKKISKLHSTFDFCLTELGVWLAAKAAESLASKEDSFFFWGQCNDGFGDKTVRKFSREAFEVFSQYLPTDRCIGDDMEADIDGGILTSKVHCLITCLSEYRSKNDLRCIIFVQRVITAIVLQSLLCNVVELSGWESQYMAGNHSGLLNQTRIDQIKIVNAFREGKVNIIVATQILEEGLDVQNCNLVVRFDPSVTVCSFIQSRGRARMQGSDYLLITKRGDSSALSKVENYLSSGDIMREESLRQASLPCEPLETEMYHEEFYCVESTGAVVTLSSSVPLIYFYCSRLPSDGYFKPLPRFNIDKESNICTLHLPNYPIETIRVSGKTDMLKQIACLEACKKLHEIGDLTDHLLPVFDVAVEDEGKANGGESYKDDQVEYFPGELMGSWSSFAGLGLYYCYMITFNQMFSYHTTFNEIILAVKSDLGPDFVSNSFSLAKDRGSVIINLKYVGIVHLNREQVLMARRFQVSILSVLIHHDLTKLMDLISHLNEGQSSNTTTYLLLPSIGGKVDWHCVNSVVVSTDNAKHRCSPVGVSRIIQTKGGALCSCLLKNCVVYTPHSGRFYFITGILDDMNGNSSLNLRRGEEVTYKEYYQTRYHLVLTRENESLLAAKHLFTVRNFLLRRAFLEEKGASNSGVELPPELCIVIMSPISVDTLYSFSCAPSIMHRIQGMLLSAKLKIQLDHCMQNERIPTMKLLEAVTTKKCREEFSLESFETLGDSFLKYVASRHLFITFGHHHEGILSAKKDRMISNAALCRLGCNRNVTGFIRTEEFDPKQWAIPGEYPSGTWDIKTSFSSSEDVYIWRTRYMKSKVVADSVEALIGAHLSSSGELAAFHFMKWLGMEIDFSKEMVVERPVIAKPEKFVNVKDLESLLKYSFKNPSFLVEALTHGSYLIPDIPRCYQRLEFLGDAVLDHLITLHLYNTYPGMTPGLLTDLRSASVNNDCYAHAAVKAGLNKHVLHMSSELHKKMSFYLDNFSQSFYGSSYGWVAGAALPKVLGDIIESIAGAIYVDSGFNKDAVWTSIRPLLDPLVSPETIEYHPVRELNELCSQKSFVKTFSVDCKNGEASITARVEANGSVYRATCTAANRKTAKMLAAKSVLKDLKASFLNFESH